MGLFIGGLGSMLILIAAVLVIITFLCEIKAINSDTAVIFKKTMLFTTVVGFAYLAAICYMKTVLKGHENLFDFEKLFADARTSSVLEIIKNGSFADGIKQGIFPLYTIISHTAGKAVFEEYTAAAICVSFVCAWFAVYFVYKLLKKMCTGNGIRRIITILVFIPGAFLLFSPSPVSMTFALMAAAAYFITENNKTAAAVLAFMSALSGYAGIAMLVVTLYYCFVKKESKGKKNKNGFFEFMDGELPPMLTSMAVLIFSGLDMLTILLYFMGGKV